MNLKSNKNNNQSSLIDNQLEMPSTIVERTLQIRPFLCKTNPIFRIFRLKSMISLKNKPNSNPIQTQTKPFLGQYRGWQSQFKAKQTQYQRYLSGLTIIYSTDILDTQNYMRENIKIDKRIIP
jgi:hypothetical protein